jgi:hypothetical protein
MDSGKDEAPATASINPSPSPDGRQHHSRCLAGDRPSKMGKGGFGRRPGRDSPAPVRLGRVGTYVRLVGNPPQPLAGFALDPASDRVGKSVQASWLMV